VIGLLQRVCRASVEIDARVIAAIDTGLLVFIGVEKDDSQAKANRLLERLLGYRIFPDADGKMNLSLAGVQGGLLLVPQFTLPADTKKGMRPSFSSAAAPELGQALFHHLVEKARAAHPTVAAGEFGAHMRVHLVNDGPVTFWLQT
jgi:D-tyrosyl-tRNA(Tyr) deacylase